VPLARRELPWFLGAVERGHPDRRAIGARFFVDPADDVRRPQPIWRKARIPDARERINVLGLHSRHRGATLVRTARRRVRRALSWWGAGVAELADAAGFGAAWARGPWGGWGSLPPPPPLVIFRGGWKTPAVGPLRRAASQ